MKRIELKERFFGEDGTGAALSGTEPGRSGSQPGAKVQNGAGRADFSCVVDLTVRS